MKNTANQATLAAFFCTIEIKILTIILSGVGTCFVSFLILLIDAKKWENLKLTFLFFTL